MKFDWKKLPTPFFVLAPMEGATDTCFRRLVQSCGEPDVYFTEFTSVDGMFSPGAREVQQRLRYTEDERPLIAQIWGIDPQLYYKAARHIVELGFDGIDINMGCPERSVVKRGACSALINNPTLASEVIEATKKGVDGRIPVSVKIRIGFDGVAIDTWIPHVLKHQPAALTVHLRTTAEMSDVPAHWELATRIRELRDEHSPETILIGNGDVKSMAQGREKAAQHGYDGIMIGRGVFHNPYVFDDSIDWSTQTKKQRLELLDRHVQLFADTWGETKHFATLKRFVKVYVGGFEDSAALRDEMMKTNSLLDLQTIIRRELHA